MIGFFLGIAATAGFLAWRRHGFRGFGGFRHGMGGCGGRALRGGPRGRQRSRWMLSALFNRLDTTEAQENTISEAADSVRTLAREQRGKLRGTRERLSRALTADQIEASEVRAILDEHDEGLAALKDRVTEALTRVHGVLDAEQRAELADILDKGWGGHRAHRAW